MIRRWLVIVVGLGLIQPLAVAEERSPDDLLMQERVTAISQGTGPVADLRIELMDGSGMSDTGLRIYEIAKGQVLGQSWALPGAPAERREGAVTDEQVRELLRELVTLQYWTFQCAQAVPDADTFLFRLHHAGLSPIDYRCDAQDYQASPERAAIRSVLLRFVGESAE